MGKTWNEDASVFNPDYNCSLQTSFVNLRQASGADSPLFCHMYTWHKTSESCRRGANERSLNKLSFWRPLKVAVSFMKAKKMRDSEDGTKRGWTKQQFKKSVACLTWKTMRTQEITSAHFGLGALGISVSMRRNKRGPEVQEWMEERQTDGC